MDTTTTSEQNDHQTDMQRKAEELGLPRVIWSDPSEYYRIVLCYNTDDDTIDRVFETGDGWDALGVRRWRQVPTHAFYVDVGEERRATMDRAWYHLACQLMVEAAPWPKQQAEEQSPPAWPPVHQAVVDALLETAVDVISVRDNNNIDSEWGRTALQLELAVLDRVARAAGIANLEERATEALRRAQHESREDGEA
jgi:hypothetical protein